MSFHSSKYNLNIRIFNLFLYKNYFFCNYFIGYSKIIRIFETAIAQLVATQTYTN